MTIGVDVAIGERQRSARQIERSAIAISRAATKAAS
jgi:hypothetical protein